MGGHPNSPSPLRKERSNYKAEDEGAQLCVFRIGALCSPLSQHGPLSLPLSPPPLAGVVLGYDGIRWWGILLISVGCAILTAILVWFVVCPRLRKKIESKWAASSPMTANQLRASLSSDP